MLIKLVLIVVITFAMFLSLWKTSLGLAVPLVCLWGYGWLTGFTVLTVKALVTITVVHLLFQTVGWWLSGRYREANLAFTGAGITGFSTGILSGMFFGPLLGFFMWWGLIGRLITQPVSIGVKPIAKSFAGGTVKLVYGVVMAGVVSYMLF